MADADGAAPISEWVKLRAHADQNQVVIGRRQSTQRKFSRLVLSLGFRLLIRLVSTRGLLQQRFSCFQPNSLTLVAFSLTRAQVCGIPFPDTQCGFKLFTRASARVLFSSTRIKRFFSRFLYNCHAILAFFPQRSGYCHAFEIDIRQVCL